LCHIGCHLRATGPAASRSAWNREPARGGSRLACRVGQSWLAVSSEEVAGPVTAHGTKVISTPSLRFRSVPPAPVSRYHI